MASKKELLINALQAVEVDERVHIPTAVFYSRNGVSIGNAAYEHASDATEINENFKLNLGEVSRGRLDPPVFDTGDGRQRSANEITKAYVDALMKSTASWVANRGMVEAKRILVAEPLALDTSETVGADWLTNYRARMRDILKSHFDEVDFLPEPFAVFQYYRYGIRHPLIVGRDKFAALVVDFGGGTFDVSVVETTATGDVSASGRNAKPLAASSVAIGGSFINYTIARELLRKNLEKGVDKGRVDRAWKTYREGADAKGGFSTLSDDVRQFVRNMRIVNAQIERAKIHIVEGIANWDLDAEYSPCPACKISIPQNPFADKPKYVEARFDAYGFREIFRTNIWERGLKDTLYRALGRASVQLNGRPLNLVLLSGGSANIRWIATLIREELSDAMPDAEILEIRSSFQEIVSKGLAIECARRTYNAGTSDFKAVTYNRLCMVVGADGADPKPYKYKLVEGVDSDSAVGDGTLLQSAYVLGGLIDKPIRWKFKLPSPPKKYLDYFLMKSSLDHEDVENRQNMDCRIHTPFKVDFSSSIWFELNVRPDGTATPKFIYKKGHELSDDIAVEGRPFYLDMTAGGVTTLGDAYVGLDFGTSNSSISYVEQSAVREYTQRASEAGWKDLNVLVNSLPYPVANPLAKFLGSTTGRDQMDQFSSSFESMLLILLVVAYQDYLICKNTHKNTAILKNLRKCSAGPIWGVLRGILEQNSKSSKISTSIKKLLSDDNRKLIDSSVSAINDHKHHRQVEFSDQCRVLGLVGNILGSIFVEWRFGYLEGVRKKAFSSSREGVFRVAHGKHGPFVEMESYRGSHDFSEVEAVLVNRSTKEVVRLSPFIFWTPPGRQGDTQIALIDSFDDKYVGYRTLEGGVHVTIDEKHDLSELFFRCSQLRSGDLLDETTYCTNAEFFQETAEEI